MKNTVALIAYEELASIRYKEQLEEFFGDAVTIETYSIVKGEVNHLIEADVYVLSFADILEYVDSCIPENSPIVCMTRTFDKEKLEQLKGLETGRVILFDYSDVLSTETAGVIREMGYSHLDIYKVSDPEEMEKIHGETVITIGANGGMLSLQNNIVDIGYYKIGITTLADIAQRLNLMDQNMSRKLYEYSKQVALTNQGIIETFKQGWNLMREFEMILELVDEGALIYNRNEEIEHCNRTFRKLTGLEDDTLGKIEPEILECVRGEENIRDRIITLTTGRTVMLSKSPVVFASEDVAFLIIIKDVSEIKRQDDKIRMNEARRGFRAKYTFNNIVSSNALMRRSIDMARKLSTTDISVLLCGESGTGKELFAQAIHNNSQRCNMPFVAINCAALPSELLESELFGYVKGAFTGANTEGKRGIFELGHKGTVFLDEVGEIPVTTQTKLLRVLQEQEVMRLGGENMISVDTRIIAATNANIEEMMHEGRFRKDLYYRLSVAQIDIPPLRERKEDIQELANLFLREMSDDEKMCFAESLEKYMCNLPWRGNVRELRNLIQYLVTVGSGELQIDDLPPRYLNQSIGNVTLNSKENVENAIRDMIAKGMGRRSIKEALDRSGNFISEYKIRKIMDESKTR